MQIPDAGGYYLPTFSPLRGMTHTKPYKPKEFLKALAISQWSKNVVNSFPHFLPMQLS